MRLRTLATAAAATLATVALTAAPAMARFIPTNPTTSGQTNSTLKVDDHSTAAADGASVSWNVKLKCPRGVAFTGDAIVEERDPASIPEIAGEDFGIRAQGGFSGTCTGGMQTLRVGLITQPTNYYDPALGTSVTRYVPISPTPANRANHAVSVSGGSGSTAFFTQYCAAPACAEVDGPSLPIR